MDFHSSLLLNDLHNVFDLRTLINNDSNLLLFPDSPVRIRILARLTLSNFGIGSSRLCLTPVFVKVLHSLTKGLPYSGCDLVHYCEEINARLLDFLVGFNAFITS